MKGPKTILAEAIANALADFFVVDKQAIETHLLGDAAVKLHDTQLQPREISVGGDTVGSVLGVVKYVAFEWHWGHSEKEGGSDWVKDVRLTISGLDFIVKLSKKQLHDGDGNEEQQLATQDAKQQSDSSSKPSGFAGYVQEQVERIMDTLTLSVQDLSLKIELPDGSQLQLGGRGVELTSKGRKDNGEPLHQDLCIQRLFISVLLPMKDLDSGATTYNSYPLLEDVSYKANTVRLFGSRFLSRFDRGMDVVGESNDQGIVVHFGEEQLQVIEGLVGLMLASPSAAPDGSLPIASRDLPSNKDQNSRETKILPGTQQDGSDGNDTDMAAGEETKKELSKLEGQPTYIMLPLAGVSVVLQNETKISLNDILLKYEMDGTTLSVEGKRGITVNDHPIFALGATSVWIADLVTKQFRVVDTTVSEQTAGQDSIGSDDDDVVVFLHGRSAELDALSEGAFQALGIHKRFQQYVPEATDLLSNMPSSSQLVSEGADSSLSWSFHLPGQVGCLYEGKGSEVELSLRDFDATMDNMLMTIKGIERVQIPGVLQLADPIDNATFQYDGAALSVKMQDVVVVLAEKDSEKDADVEPEASPDEAASSKDGFDLPCGFHLEVNNFLAFKPDAKSVHTTVDTLQLKMDPPETQSNCNAHMSVSVSELNHDMVRLKETSMSASLVLFSDYDILSSLQFGSKEIHVAAGYSLADWKALLPKRGRSIEKKPFKLPYSHIDQLKVGVLVKSMLVGVSETVLNVKEFKGEETTTSDDLIKFYNKEVISKVPGMIVNAQVLGTNLGDNVVATLGNLAGAAGGVLGGAGGVLSVAAFDGVKNTVKQGKLSRGVEDTDDWKISDLALGLKHAAIRATREGAAKRGKGQDQGGDALDWAVGATDDVTKYAGENKARLAGAGAGAAGFTYGMLIGGPLGAVVGGLAASAATQKTVETIEDATTTIKIGGATLTVHDENPVAKSHDDNLVFSGLLLKRQDFVHWDWRAHYFVLTKDALKYYNMSKAPRRSGTEHKEHDLFFDSSEAPRKSLEFQNHYVGSDGKLSKPKDNLFVLTIHSLEQAEPLWVLGAQTEADRSEWLSKLSEVMAGNNDKRMSRIGLHATSAAMTESTSKELLRQSLPPEIRDLIE